MDETLDQVDPANIGHGDVVGIGVHTANALRGYEIGRMARDRGAYVVFGGIHANATLGGRIEASQFSPARWDLLPRNRYMWASVQTVRGCLKHCSFCSVWRTDSQRPRQRTSDAVIEEIVELRRLGFRFIALADDNFYPVTLSDLRLAAQQNNPGRLHDLES